MEPLRPDARESVSRFLGLVAPASGEYAFVDWVSGLIIINEPIDAWQVLADKIRRAGPGYAGPEIDARDRLLQETFTHEFAHVLQFCLYGFPHRIALDLFGILRSRFVGANPPTLDACVASIRQEDVEAAQKVIGKLLHEVDGVSALALLESGAFLVQARTHRPNLTPPYYRAYLEWATQGDTTSPYRSAYDYAERHFDSFLEAPPFDTFPAFAAAALCTPDPAKTFTELCNRVPLIGEHEPSSLFLGLKDAVEHIGCGPFRLASDVARDSAFELPFFTGAIGRLAARHKADARHTITLCAESHRFQESDVDALCPPIVFRRQGTVWGIQAFEGAQSAMSREPDQAMLDRLMCVCAMSSVLLQASRGPHASIGVSERITRDSAVARAAEANAGLAN